MASKSNYKNEWHGDGWYTIREWIYTDGEKRVENWADPEQPGACWYETEDEFVKALTDDPERDSTVWWFGRGECPNDTVPVAPGHNLDYGIWNHLRKNFAYLWYNTYKSGSMFVPALYRLLAEYRDELTAKPQ